MTEPVPRHDQEAEEQLLGSILFGGAPLLDRVHAFGVTAGSFWYESNRVVFLAAVDVAGRGEVVDVLTVKRELERTERIHAAGGGPRVQSLPSTVTTVASWATRAQLLLEAERSRGLLTVGQRIVAASGNGGLSADEASDLVERLPVLSGHSRSAQLRGVDRLDVGALLLAPPPAIRWAWKGYIEAGTLTVLHGDGGLGKSLLALGLARATIQGGHFLHRPTRAARVLVVDGENGLDEIARRLHGWDFAGHADAIDYLRADAPMIDPDDMSALRREIASADVGLAILDGQRALWGGDEKEALEVVRLYQALYHQVAEPTGAAVLLLHHDNKGGGYSGSTAINGGVASRLHLEAVPDGQRVVRLVHAKARGSAPMPPLDYRLSFDAGRYLSTIVSIGGASDNPKVEQAAVFVHERGHATTREIADAVDKDERTVRRWVKDGGLAMLGVVSEDGHHRPAGAEDGADTDMADITTCPPPIPSNQAESAGGHDHTADIANVRPKNGSVDPEPVGGHLQPPTGAPGERPDGRPHSPDHSHEGEPVPASSPTAAVVSAGLPDRPSGDAA